MKKAKIFLSIFTIMVLFSIENVFAQNDYYYIINRYSRDNLNMTVTKDIKNGFLIAGQSNGELFADVVDYDGNIVKSIDIPQTGMVFYNIYKLKDYYYLYGGYYSIGENNIHIIIYTINKDFEFVESKQIDFTETSPTREFVGIKEDSNYYYDYKYNVKVDKTDGTFSRIEEMEYPEFVRNRDSIIKNITNNNNATVDLIYTYLDGFAILYRVTEQYDTSFYIGYVKDNELLWTVPGEGVTVYTMGSYSNYIVTTTYSSGYTINLYDETGELVSSESIENYGVSNVTWATFWAGSDYLDITVKTSNDANRYTIMSFRDNHFNYNIFTENDVKDEIILSTIRAEEDDIVSIEFVKGSKLSAEKIAIFDENGVQLRVDNNTFIMPNSNVTIKQGEGYVENTIGNPKTISFYIMVILSPIILIGSMIALIVIKKLRKD